MNVEELIEILEKEQNKTKEVYIFNDSELSPIDMVDLTISDRVDINISEVM